MIIAPSLLAADFLNLGAEVERINKTDAEWLHLDVMDGNFVPNISFGMDIVKVVSEKCTKKLDLHLMVENPDKFIDQIIESKMDYVSFHAEVVNNFVYSRFIERLQEQGIKVGVAINPNTSVRAVQRDIFLQVDFALIMSVYPGAGGQAFMPEVLEKANEIKKINKELLIEIDGGVNADTIGQIKDYPIDSVVSGSYLFKGDMEENIKTLR